MMANRSEPHCYNKECNSKVLYQKGDFFYCKNHKPNEDTQESKSGGLNL